MLHYPLKPQFCHSRVNGNPGKEVIGRSGFLLEFIPVKTGAGMTKISIYKCMDIGN
jgi:hypothetical protein